MYQPSLQFSSPNLQDSARWHTQEPQENTNAGVTEIVLAADTHTQFELILPMLAHLSRNTANRWFTWIAPKGLSRQTLDAYGFDLSKVRLIHTRSDEETLWVLWQALAQGNSDTVVASPGRLAEKALDELETVAKRGNSRSLLIRYR